VTATLTGHTDAAMAVTVTADGCHVVSDCDDVIGDRQPATGHTGAEFEAAGSLLQGVAVSPDMTAAHPTAAMQSPAPSKTVHVQELAIEH